MKFYLIRHGDAVPSQALNADAIRPLSKLGEAEVATNGKWLHQHLREQGVEQLDWLISSPYIRARQTAAIVHQHCSAMYQSESADATPDGDPQQFADWLFAELAVHHTRAQHVALVSHMPFVSYLVQTLDATRQPIVFPTASIAEFELDLAMQRGTFQGLTVPDTILT
ncbi:phosphohistidine phosphatase SixA [Pseudidiomarina aestuarii]|uniref:Phosphohistidine phosphatase SixA n=1 Tax=Pseudidiomarina aestuarii TaxID=624146 RepID=A0A7Z6ZTU1_9GAMM|nr:phosphohistidine phosphatase SixA [Pseudidiomarina aestuarii]RUO41263.1 phosphohistidine phosphatase SixA [Pseudidiomarina aestuarii]